jgi:hypothetical protein
MNGAVARTRGCCAAFAATASQSLSREFTAGDLRVRRNAENPRAQLGLEAVHHRQHDDQRSDAERNPRHRGKRDEADEVVATLGARVTQADQQFVAHAEGYSILKCPAMNADARRSLARLVRARAVASLGTLRWGAPNVSMVAYMPAHDFATFWLRLSRLAWHTHDLAADARVSLAICETDDGREDPQTLARVTLRGEAVKSRLRIRTRKL